MDTLLNVETAAAEPAVHAAHLAEIETLLRAAIASGDASNRTAATLILNLVGAARTDRARHCRESR
jgi:hypothetical protein